MESMMIDETQKLTVKQLEMLQDLLEIAGDYLKIEQDAELSVTFVDNKKIHEINLLYRDVDRPTDVISFALEEELEEEVTVQFSSGTQPFPRNLGDILISVEKAETQAKEYKHSFERELGFLLVHGFLHLNGYDHLNEKDEKEMFDLQREILTAYGLKR